MLKDREKSDLYHELSSLSRAGFPLLKAADTALDTKPPAGQRQFLEDLKRGIAGGETLSGAAGASEVSLTPLEVSILRASEEAGRIPEGFAHLSEYFGMRHQAAKKIRAGLVYPFVLLHFAIFLPAIPRAFATQNLKGTVIETLVLLLVVYSLVAAIAIVYRRFSKRAETDPAADRLLRRLPLIGKVRHAFALSRFAEVLHIQLRCGRGPLRGIRSAAEASGSASLLASARRFVLPEIDSGNRAGPGFVADRGKQFPNAFARAYATAEETGGLDEEMARWGLVFANQAETAIDRLAAAVPKIIYALVAIFVIYQIFRMATHYFQVIEDMSKSIG